mgnify:CR=1 FL=1
MLTSPTNTTNSQHLNMTMETSDEVSTRQEVGMESSICDSLGKREGSSRNRSKHWKIAQKHTIIAQQQTMEMTMETTGEVSSRRDLEEEQGVVVVRRRTGE